ncbi:MAG: hypothetical protein PHN56_03850 [Candidatus Nanoarchaeia archaeon]|nr:hypothetical protein [Candidatus Nanoarchaeia archaeon]
MPNLYNKSDFDENWNIVNGFFKTIESNYKLLIESNEHSLKYPLIDEFFHIQEKIALCLLIVKKEDAKVNHKIIMAEFNKEFESNDAFKKFIPKYFKIFSLKDSLLYHFDKDVDFEEIKELFEYIEKFKEQAERYFVYKKVI